MSDTLEVRVPWDPQTLHVGAKCRVIGGRFQGVEGYIVEFDRGMVHIKQRGSRPDVMVEGVNVKELTFFTDV